MSQHRSMSARQRRGWAIGLVAFFVLMCSMIAYSEWYAYHVNVPAYERHRP